MDILSTTTSSTMKWIIRLMKMVTFPRVSINTTNTSVACSRSNYMMALTHHLHIRINHFSSRMINFFRDLITNTLNSVALTWARLKVGRKFKLPSKSLLVLQAVSRGMVWVLDELSNIQFHITDSVIWSEGVLIYHIEFNYIVHRVNLEVNSLIPDRCFPCIFDHTGPLRSIFVPN